MTVIERRRLVAKHHGPLNFVFSTESGRHIQACNLRRTLRHVLKGTDLEGLVTPHAYKRRMATDADAHFGREAASDMTGTSVRVLESHYIQHDDVQVVDPTTFRTGT